MIIQIAVTIFLLLELSNVLALYFTPETQRGNAMGAFTVWESSKDDKATHLLLRYMSSWVAGTKLIFIFLLFVILAFGDEQLQLYALIALVLAILTYFWRLRPLMNEMDAMGYLQPAGYSATLTKMIAAFVLLLSAAGIAEFIW